VVDKDTEYLANFNTKSRRNPVDLLRAYINTTGKRPRYLRYNRLCAQEELFNHVITRSQSQAAERAKQNDLILSSTPQQADDKHSSRKGAKPALASKPISAAKDCIVIPMSEMLELSLTHAFVTHKYPVTLPVHFNPAGMPTPKGDTIVIAVKAQKQTREKATVWVEFLSPPSHAGKQIQLYPKSLEPKNGPAQGADFSLLAAVKAQFPHAVCHLA
jgi:hypothetical protein